MVSMWQTTALRLFIDQVFSIESSEEAEFISDIISQSAADHRHVLPSRQVSVRSWGQHVIFNKAESTAVRAAGIRIFQRCPTSPIVRQRRQIRKIHTPH